jgi:hypothetical protein
VGNSLHSAIHFFDFENFDKSFLSNSLHDMNNSLHGFFNSAHISDFNTLSGGTDMSPSVAITSQQQPSDYSEYIQPSQWTPNNMHNVQNPQEYHSSSTSFPCNVQQQKSNDIFNGESLYAY